MGKKHFLYSLTYPFRKKTKCCNLPNLNLSPCMIHTFRVEWIINYFGLSLSVFLFLSFFLENSWSYLLYEFCRFRYSCFRGSGLIFYCSLPWYLYTGWLSLSAEQVYRIWHVTWRKNCSSSQSYISKNTLQVDFHGMISVIFSY